MSRRRSRGRRPVSLAVRATLGAVALGRLVRTARRHPALTAPGAGAVADLPAVSIVVPARDEAARLGPLLDRVVGAPGVHEVVVVDDQSADATPTLARAAGARVVAGQPLPPGWAGKAWAVHQGIEAATGEWIVTLDADTRPDPALPSAIVTRARADGIRFVTLAGRFECPTTGLQWLHPAMLTTLVVRFGAPGAVRPPRPGRELANGQCMAFRRDDLLAVGGMAPVAGAVVEDVALARVLSTRGWTVGMLDGSALLTTRMYEDLGDAWRGWGRSLALPGVESRSRQLVDLAVVLAAQALPLPRLLVRRGDLVDVVLLLVRLGTLVGTRRAYERPGPAYWCSPLADVPAAVALGRGIVRRRQTWRGRNYTPGEVGPVGGAATGGAG